MVLADELLVSLVTLSVLEAPPPLELLVVGPIEEELLPEVLPPKPLLLTPLVLALEDDTVVIPRPPVVEAPEVVEFTEPTLVVVTVLLETAFDVVAVPVVWTVAVDPIVSFKGSFSSAASLQAAIKAQRARAAPQRSWRIVLKSRVVRRAGTALPRRRLASTWGIDRLLPHK